MLRAGVVPRRLILDWGNVSRFTNQHRHQAAGAERGRDVNVTDIWPYSNSIQSGRVFIHSYLFSGIQSVTDLYPNIKKLHF